MPAVTRIHLHEEIGTSVSERSFSLRQASQYHQSGLRLRWHTCQKIPQAPRDALADRNPSDNTTRGMPALTHRTAAADSTARTLVSLLL